MNRLVIAVFLLCSTATNALADALEYELDVKGMVCAFCAYNVSKQLRSLEGVAPQSVEVDLAGGSVRLRSDRKLDEAMLAELVETAGFELASVVETTSSSSLPAPARAEHRVLISLTLDVDGLGEGEYDDLLEALGVLAAQRAARLTVVGPAGLEMPTLRPMLMGHEPAMDAEFVEEVRPDGTVLIEVFAD